MSKRSAATKQKQRKQPPQAQLSICPDRAELLARALRAAASRSSDPEWIVKAHVTAAGLEQAAAQAREADAALGSTELPTHLSPLPRPAEAKGLRLLRPVRAAAGIH